MTNRRMREIQIKADEFRNNCKVIRYGIADIFGECERAGFELIRYPAGQSEVLGFAQIRDDNKIIFSNSSVRLAREIFTVAHEIGHMCLHMGAMKGSYIDNVGTFCDDGSEGAETEANYFAACLLMPEDVVAKYIALEMNDKPITQWSALDIARMMTAFRVSFDMALHRLHNLNKINSANKIRLDSEKNQQKVSNLLKATGEGNRLNVKTNEKRLPPQYMSWVIENYNQGLIPKETLEKALGYFDVDIEDVIDELYTAEIDEQLDLEELIGGIDE